MRGLDTNVLVRMLVRDDPALCSRVDALLDSLEAEQERSRIDAVALVETVCVLRSRYSFRKEQVAAALSAILDNSGVVVDGHDEARAALGDWRVGTADFSDYYLARRNRAAGCRDTVTFDEDLAEFDGATGL
jgi:predicted nucleic-acid-binding protein